jgi:hypothetical protein
MQILVFSISEFRRILMETFKYICGGMARGKNYYRIPALNTNLGHNATAAVGFL